MIPDDGRAESPSGICVPKHVTGSLISARDWRAPKTIAFGRFLWAPRVRFHLKIVKRRHRPVVGDLEPSYEAFERPAERGLTVQTYAAEPGKRSADALRMVAN